MSGLVQQEEVQGRGQKLQGHLLPGLQAEILLLLDLEVIVQEADGAEDQSKGEDEGRGPGLGDYAEDVRANQGSQNKDQTAHGRSAGLGGVPLGADLADGLPGLHGAQPGNDKAACNQCDYEAGQHGQDDSQYGTFIHG